MRKIFWENLPKINNGKNKGQVKWSESIGSVIPFVYDDIKGEIQIVNYKDGYVYIKYLNKEIFRIKPAHFKRCQFGELLGKKTSRFKIENGTVFIDNKRNLLIIDRKVCNFLRNDGNLENKKYYKYKCNICGYQDGWLLESVLLRGNGCSCCGNQVVIEGINDIPTTAPWMVKYFQGGYDEAKFYSKRSDKKIYPICPDCKRVRNKAIIISNIYNQGISCPCGDGLSYPEKFIFSLFEQLGIDFKSEYSPNWIKPKRYDLYFKLNDEKYIVEMDGGFHNNNNKMSGQTKEQSQEIDNYKNRLAKEHKIEIIRINSTISELDYIKNNILESRLKELFDLSLVNWYKCEEFALSNLIKTVCDYKKDNPNKSVKEIALFMKLGKTTVSRYLKRGSNLGWCEYIPEEERERGYIKLANIVKNREVHCNSKKVLSIDTGHIFKSIAECEQLSKDIFGVKIARSSISRVCNGTQSETKGYKFQYVE